MGNEANIPICLEPEGVGTEVNICRRSGFCVAESVWKVSRSTGLRTRVERRGTGVVLSKDTEAPSGSEEAPSEVMGVDAVKGTVAEVPRSSGMPPVEAAAPSSCVPSS